MTREQMYSENEKVLNIARTVEHIHFFTNHLEKYMNTMSDDDAQDWFRKLFDLFQDASVGIAFLRGYRLAGLKDFFALQLRALFEEARMLYVRRFPDLQAPSFREVCPYLACPTCNLNLDDETDAVGMS